MAQFSGAIRISDLNDYISPSQACVVALKGSKLQVSADADEIAGEVALQPPLKQQRQQQQQQQQEGPSPAPGAKPHWTQAQAAAPGEAIKVTLHDCLACSGCVTSAETVLLESQSGTEFLSKLAQARHSVAAAGVSPGVDTPGPGSGMVVVVSVAPQSIAALAALYGLSAAETFARLSSWLVSQGAAAVLDVRQGRDLALMETAAEFVDRYRSSHQCSTSAPSAQPGSSPGSRPAAAGGPLPRSLPMLASACPGWVCYAEKTHGEFVLPHISTTKSPQAVMGTLVKRLLASYLGSAAQVYHATVMPCYDKKLEAARDELTLPGGVAEVDCCLTTSEVHKLLSESGITHLSQVALIDPRQGPGAGAAAHLAALPPTLQALLQPTQGPGSWPVQESGLWPVQESGLRPVLDSGLHPVHGSDSYPRQDSGWRQLANGSSGGHGMSAGAGDGGVGGVAHRTGGDDAMQVDEEGCDGAGQAHALTASTPSHSAALQGTSAAAGGAGRGGAAGDAGMAGEAGVAAGAGGAGGGSLGFQGVGGSGGYMEYVFRTAARQLFGVEVPPGPLPLKTLRNADFQEVVLESPSGGAPLLRCAQAYGFRNIQSLMRKIKMGKCEYHFIEVMACPSGCLNGGGQLKAQQGETPTQLLERLELTYNQAGEGRAEPQSSALVQQLYQHWVQGQPGSEAARQLLHTTYRKRERAVGGLASDW